MQVIDPDSFEYRIGRGVLVSLRGEPIVVGNRALIEQLGITPPENHGALGGTEVLVAKGGRYYGS